MNIMVGGRTYVLLPENYFIKNMIVHAGEYRAKIQDLPRTIFTIKEDYFIKISSYTRVETTWVHWSLDRYSRIRNVHRCLLLVMFRWLGSGNYGELDAAYWVCRCKLLSLFYLKLSSVSQGSFNGPFSFLGF